MSSFTFMRGLVSYGRTASAQTDDVTTIVRADCWHLSNPRTQQKVTLANCPANLPTLHAYLKASWTLDNDDESITGYTAPPDTGAGALGGVHGN